MRSAHLLMVALVGSASPISAQPATSADDERTIVVTGKPLAELNQQLARCLARRCPPAEDMRLSLAVAEARFVAGAYRDARGALKASLQRHPGAARQHAPLVAALHRASARISQHYGDRDAYARSTYEVARTLRQAYPDDSPQLFFARLEAADMLVRTGAHPRALRAYEALASQARRLGDRRLATIVDLRLAWLEILAGRATAGEARLRRLVAAAAGDPAAGLNADVMMMRVARLRGRDAEADRLMGLVLARSSMLTRPQLLFAPPIDLDQAPEPIIAAADDRVVMNGANRRSISSPEQTWIDVGYWITPDGRVGEAEVLRAARGRDRWWHARVLDSVARRRYSGFASLDGDSGVYRIERFTLNSWLTAVAGSRMPGRSGRLKVESLDLTPDTAAPPAS